MKIIKKGLSKTQLKNGGWIGKIISCDNCGCHVKLESGDKVQKYHDHENEVYYIVPCPNCKENIFFV